MADQQPTVKELRRQPGRCRQCGEPAEEGRSRCGPCREKRLAQERANAERLYRKGLCRTCKGPLDGPSMTCKRCRDRNLSQVTRKQDANRKAGRCPKCGGEPAPGRSHCPACLEKYKAKSKARYKPNRHCRRCGEPLTKPKSRFCRACTRRRLNHESRAWRQRMRAEGRCPQCCKPCDRDGSLCTACLAGMKARRQKTKEACFAGYGGKCKCCGETCADFLSIDHVNDDGARRRKSKAYPGAGLGDHIYRWLIRNNFPSAYQVLCANCQWGKRLNNGVCPHQKGRR